MSCCVPLCNNRHMTRPDLSYYRIPACEIQRKKWVKAIRREGWKPTQHSKICSWHFPEGPEKPPTRFHWTVNKNQDSEIQMRRVKQTSKDLTSGVQDVLQSANVEQAERAAGPVKAKCVDENLSRRMRLTREAAGRTKLLRADTLPALFTARYFDCLQDSNTAVTENNTNSNQVTEAFRQTLLQFQKTGYLCDTVLVAEDGEAKAHSVILAAASPIFKASLRPTEKPIEHVVVLPGLDLYVVEIAILFAYTGKVEIPQEHMTSEKINLVMISLQELGFTLNPGFLKSSDKNVEREVRESGAEPSREESVAVSELSRDTEPAAAETGVSDVIIAASGDEPDVNLCQVDETEMDCGDDESDTDSADEESTDVASSELLHSDKHLPTDTETIRDDNDLAPIGDLLSKIMRSGTDMRRTFTAVDGTQKFQTDNTQAYMLRWRSTLDGKMHELVTPSGELKNRLHDSAVELAQACRPRHIWNQQQTRLCEECGLLVPSALCLESHQRLHTGERPFECSECHRKFRARKHLHRHQKIHSGDRPFFCEHCGDRFLQHSQLIQHKSMHHCELYGIDPDVRRVRCKVCAEEFKTHAQRLQHMATKHRELKDKFSRRFLMKNNYICATCGYVSQGKFELAEHSRIHTGARPFLCHICHRRYRFRSTLRSHMETHLVNGDQT